MKTLVLLPTQVITSSAARAPCGSSTSPETFATVSSVPPAVLDTLARVHSPAIAGLHTGNVSAATTKASTFMAFPQAVAYGADRSATRRWPIVIATISPPPRSPSCSKRVALGALSNVGCDCQLPQQGDAGSTAIFRTGQTRERTDQHRTPYLLIETSDPR